ncbi:MAG: response regulator [Gammaproteobacteria bacterium]|nr:response regulator [Gammaproteobacteria bacterium]
MIMNIKKILALYVDVIDRLSRLFLTNYNNAPLLDSQVQLFFKQVPSVVIATSIVATALSFIFYDTAGLTQAITWVLSVYLLTIARFFSVWRYNVSRQAGLDKIGNRSWSIVGISFSMISGFQWGVAVLLYFNPESMVDISILILVELAMIAAAVASLSVIPLAFIGYATPVGLMTAYPLFFSGNSDLYILGVLIIVYLLAMNMFCRNIYKATMFGIRMSIENADLIKSLKIEKNKSESANLAKSRFLAAASHDLRQPLQALTLFTEALKEDVKEEKHHMLVDRVAKSLDALKGLLNSLLDISKLDAGGVKVCKTGFDICTVLNEIRTEFQPMAVKKFQQLAVSNSSFFVFSDPILVKRIIQNLVANAIKHSPEEAMIIVDIKPGHEYGIITVKDNGPGIPENEITKVFNEFYQLNNPERDRNKGLGLGLAIVKRLTDLLSITLSFESQPGSGCIFSLVIPKAESHQMPVQQLEPAALLTGRLNGLNVLVVEDEIDVRESLVMLLEGWGCEVWQTDNIAGAIALVNQNPVALVITDYRLRQNETGLELLKQINAFDKDISGLVITGDTSVEKIKEFMNEDYLVLHKPIKPAELRVAITQLTTETAGSLDKV